MKAYQVTDGWDNSEVVFADSPGQAKTMLDWWCDGKFIDLRVTRAPAFDDIQGNITSRHYIERGWHIPCGYCDTSVYSDSEGLCYGAGDTAYCSKECLDKMMTIRKRYSAPFREKEQIHAA